MKMAKLRTGKEVPEPLVMTTMLSLQKLMDENLLALFALTDLCEDGKTTVQHEESLELLRTYSLLQPDGRVHDDIREIVLAGTKGYRFGMELISPLAE